MKNTIATFLITSTLAFGGVVVIDESTKIYAEDAQKFALDIAQDRVDTGKNKLEISKDEPKVKLSKWDDIGTLSIGYTKEVKAKANKKLLSNVIEWKDKDISVRAYPVTITNDGEINPVAFSFFNTAHAQVATNTVEGVEFEVIWSKVPATTTVEFEFVNWENFDFYFQPPLTQAEIDEGHVRPANIVNSYAVYSKALKNHEEGAINYETGKFAHIYRLKAIDANGDWVWIDNVSYSNGVLTATVDQTWAQNAVYPVIVDPTLGYTTVGGSNINVLASDDIYALDTTATEDGTVSSISVYNSNAIGSNWKGVLTGKSGLTIVSGGVGGATAIVDATWTTSTGMSASITNTTSYMVGWIADSQSGFYYDTGANGVSQRDTTNSYTTPENWSGGQDRTYIMSIYATYTASGGGGTPVIRQSIFDDE